MELEYTNVDFVSLEYQAFLHSYTLLAKTLSISSVICCITRSLFLFSFVHYPSNPLKDYIKYDFPHMSLRMIAYP